MVPAPPVTRTCGAVERAHRPASSCGRRGSRRPGAAALGQALRRRPRARTAPAARPRRRCAAARSSRMLAANSVDHRAERLALGQRRRPGVAEPVGDRGRGPVGAASTRLLVEVDAAVVDAEPLLRVEVVPDQRALGAADDHLPDLGRAQPVDVHVGDRAARQRQREVADAGLAGAERVGAVRGDARRAQPAGQDEVEDRQVVRREVPEHVDVGLDEPEVDPHRVDEQDLAELAVRDQLADLAAPPACSSRCGRPSGPGRCSRPPRPSRGRRSTLSASGFSTSTCLPARSAGQRDRPGGCGPASRWRPRRRRRGPAPRRATVDARDVAARRRRPAGPARRRGRRPRPGPSRRWPGSCGPGSGPQ